METIKLSRRDFLALTTVVATDVALSGLTSDVFSPQEVLKPKTTVLSPMFPQEWKMNNQTVYTGSLSSKSLLGYHFDGELRSLVDNTPSSVEVFDRSLFKQPEKRYNIYSESINRSNSNPRYGTAGYPQERERLGLNPNALVYSWGFYDGDNNDNFLLRKSVVFENGKWKLRGGISEFAKKYPGNRYYPLNEPIYENPRPTSKELAILTHDLQEAVSDNGIIYTPGFAQTEIGHSWWGGVQKDIGPDGKEYDYADSYIRWMKELYGKGSAPSFISFHAYPSPDVENKTNEILGVIHAIMRIVDRTSDAFPPNIEFALTEVGLIKSTCAGPVAAGGWNEGKRFMDNLFNLVEVLPSPGIQSVCWFIPRSEACSKDGAYGGWPGYLVYSNYDPNGEPPRGGFFCTPYYFSFSQVCQIEKEVGTPNTLTPLGEQWKQIAARPKKYKIFLPYI